MPCFRGVDVSIVVVQGEEAAKLPEFPHPDASSVSVRPPSPKKYGSSGSAVFLSPRRPPSPAKSESDSQLVKVNPKISVYIPSLPGTFGNLSPETFGPE